MQTKIQSAIESLLNVAVGMGVAFTSQLIVFPLVGIPEQTMATHMTITLWFTFISLVRSYVIRRWFNGFHFKNKNELQKQAGEG